MGAINAFVGHSFEDRDAEVVRELTDFFNTLKESEINLQWDHAKPAERKVLSQKVREKMQGKNLFIGICTKKERVLNNENLKNIFFSKKLFLCKEKDFEWKVSDWILQEISYADGKAMELILLVENGLRIPGGLQGNIEHIPFSRDEISKSFPKIIQMLKGFEIEKSKKDLTPKSDKKEITEDKRQLEEKESVKYEELNVKSTWKKDDYDARLGLAIIWGKEEKEEDIYSKFLTSKFSNSDDEIIIWNATRLFYQAIYGKKDILDKLLQLESNNDSLPKIKFYIAKIYESYGEFEVAGKYYIKAGEKYSDIKLKVDAFCTAGKSYARLKNQNQEIECIIKVLSFEKLDEELKLKILKTLIQIAGLKEDYLLFNSYNEGLLSKLPLDHKRRFKLAFDYQDKDESMALYHYNLLLKLENETDEMAINNIGVSEGRLDLQYSAISHYKEAMKMGNTLAMSNIARTYLDAGFLDEAEDICNKAVQVKNFDKAVGTTITLIQSAKESDEKEREEILEKVEDRRRFLINFAASIFEKQDSKLPEKWLCNNGVIIINDLKNNIFTASISYPRSSLLFGELFGKIKGENRTIKVKYDGVVYGKSIKFKKIEQTWNDSNNKKEKQIEYQGILVINKENNVIKLMEIDEKYEVNFESWTPSPLNIKVAN